MWKGLRRIKLRCRSFLITLALTIPALRAQTALKFEAASVRPGCETPPAGAGDAGRGAVEGLSPATFRMCATVAQLINSAYVMYADGRFHFVFPKARIVEGGPAWMNSDRYQVVAKAGSAAGQETMRGPMLQSLLEDRFQLKVRRETRTVPTYDLVAAKGGLKLKPSVEGSCVPWDVEKDASPPVGGDKMPCSFPIPGSKHAPGLLALELHGISLNEFSKMLLTLLVDRPVIDKTGSTERYDIHLEYAPPRPASPTDNGTLPQDTGPSIFTALEEQLGLKLEPAKGPGEFLVIERLERPSGN
jgi:uncharacterized protein (TIGR03435 family)